MEKTTLGVYLMYKNTTISTPAWGELIPITEYPNMGSEPEKIDISTLNSRFKRYAQGMVDTSDLTFKAIYDADKKTLIDGLADTETQYALYFDTPDNDNPNGAYGKYFWKGTVYATEEGAGTNSARTLSIAFYPTTEIATTEIAD